HGFGMRNVDIQFQNDPEKQRTGKKTGKVNVIIHREQSAVIQPLVFKKQKDERTNESSGCLFDIHSKQLVFVSYKKPSHPDPDDGHKKGDGVTDLSGVVDLRQKNGFVRNNAPGVLPKAQEKEQKSDDRNDKFTDTSVQFRYKDDPYCQRHQIPGSGKRRTEKDRAKEKGDPFVQIIPVNRRKGKKDNEPEEIEYQISFDKLPEICIFFTIRQPVIFAEKQKRTDHKIYRNGDPAPGMKHVKTRIPEYSRMDDHHNKRYDEFEQIKGIKTFASY
ncbi:MAG: hypothetical protein IKR99_05425, partial [Lachnospiraceae bacterium]|nr:hypothetical protein [Lachnospiraceae bacterium]